MRPPPACGRVRRHHRSRTSRPELRQRLTDLVPRLCATNAQPPADLAVRPALQDTSARGRSQRLESLAPRCFGTMRTPSKGFSPPQDRGDIGCRVRNRPAARHARRPGDKGPQTVNSLAGVRHHGRSSPQVTQSLEGRLAARQWRRGRTPVYGQSVRRRPPSTSSRASKAPQRCRSRSTGDKWQSKWRNPWLRSRRALETALLSQSPLPVREACRELCMLRRLLGTGLFDAIEYAGPRGSP